MTITICKTFTFDAAHHIPTMPEGHKCRRMHGHTYRVDFLFQEKVADKRGFFLDYGDIAVYWDRIAMLVDHRILNDIPGLSKPTTEVLAKWIYMQMVDILLVSLATVNIEDSRGFVIGKHFCAFNSDGQFVLEAARVHESSTTWCEYRPRLMLVMASNACGLEVGLLAGRYPGRIGHLYSPGGSVVRTSSCRTATTTTRGPRTRTSARGTRPGGAT